MKAVIMAPLPPPAGGIASWAVRMQNAGLKNNWTVEIVDEKIIGRSVHGDKNKKNFFVEAKRCFTIWRKLKFALRDPESKVVHACTAATTTGMLRDIVSAWITHRRHRKYIIHFRCTVSNLISGGFKKKVFRILCSSSDMIFTLNKQSEEYIKKSTKTPVRLIPNFVGDEEYKNVQKQQYYASVRTVLYTGGVTEEKGCAEIIRAAAAFPDIRFRLVGNIRREISDMDIPSNVILTGVQPEYKIQEELRNADLFVFFTHMDSEGFANSLVEAMGAGLPCIVTDWAANSDMIENKGGIILPVHDVDGLIRAIVKLRDDRDLRERMGEWNISKVNASYSGSVVTGQYVDAYESLLRE